MSGWLIGLLVVNTLASLTAMVSSMNARLILDRIFSRQFDYHDRANSDLRFIGDSVRKLLAAQGGQHQ